MTSPGGLADYLKARRERLQPEDVGIILDNRRRRVPGLRREEIAILAGISTDYYLRLEQGHDVNPSVQVLDALARALRLDPIAAHYLHGLARPVVVHNDVDRDDKVQDSVRWLIDSWTSTSAVVHNRYLDILASNNLARSLNPNYRPGVNSVLVLFTDPAEKVFHRNWERVAAHSVAQLRLVAGARRGDTRLDDLIAEGSARSDQFREFWERQDVAHIGNGRHELRHPQRGELVVNYQRLSVTGTDGHSIFLYFALPGTTSALEMRRLAASGYDQQGQAGIVSPV